LSQPPQPELFVPHLQGTAKDNQTPANKMFLFIKADSAPLSLVNSVRMVVRSLDPEQPVADVARMEDRLRASLSMQRFQLDLLGAFAVVALVLAAVGVYGVLSYSVRLRMHEIGVRMALGATGSDVLRMTARHGLALGVAGILIGVVAALGVTRMMASLLFGIQPNDAATFLGASLVLLAVVGIATLVPSARAARTDPMAVLRAE
jgi:putative ABC transport system permease protein